MVASTFLALFMLVQAPAPSALEQFFIGRTQGEGTVNMMMSRAHAVRDRSLGHLDRSGALILDQVVEEEGKPARRRLWRLQRSGPSGVTGTISDARGPVSGQLRGNVLTLRYRAAEGPSVEQTITLDAGGRRATNRMVFRRFGLRVATVQSVIRRVP